MANAPRRPHTRRGQALELGLDVLSSPAHRHARENALQIAAPLAALRSGRRACKGCCFGDDPPPPLASSKLLRIPRSVASGSSSSCCAKRSGSPICCRQSDKALDSRHSHSCKVTEAPATRDGIGHRWVHGRGPRRLRDAACAGPTRGAATLPLEKWKAVHLLYSRPAAGSGTASYPGHRAIEQWTHMLQTRPTPHRRCVGAGVGSRGGGGGGCRVIEQQGRREAKQGNCSRRRTICCLAAALSRMWAGAALPSAACGAARTRATTHARC